METFALLLSVVFGISAYFIIRRLNFLSRLPPGPWGLPVIGKLIHLNRNNALREFQKWKGTYGNIFSFSLGDFYVIVLNDYKTMMEALKRDEFQGRPDFQTWTGRNLGVKNRGILFSDGVHSWSEQRRFALRTLRDFGFGKRSMEGLLQHEVEELIKKFRKDGSNGKPIEMRTSFNASVFNSLWYIVTGERFELDDPNFHKLLAKMQGHLQQVTFTSPANFYPWPAKRNLIRRGVWKRMMVMYGELLNFFDKLIQDHVSTYEQNQTRDYIDTYLHHVKEKKEDPESSFNDKEWRTSLKIVMLDLFSAGAETSSTTLLWAMLYMTKFPEVQEKLHQEIDSVIGKNRFPTREDKLKLPYLEAFTNEVHRKSTIIPMSVYHAMQADFEYEGFLFPKGAVIFQNLYEVHNDPEYWGDPENFRPERFLDESGAEPKLIKHEALVPFSTGKRQCLGETLARDTLFQFLVGLLQNFSFELDPSCQSFDFLNQMKPMFVVAPDPFKIILHPRKEWELFSI